MSYCLNLNSQKVSSNPDQTQFCQNCGDKLLLKERYRAIKLIGQGGFGRTFLAVDEDKPSKPRCVIKQFYPQAQGTNNSQKAAELFEQEAVRLDDLGKHPHIPELLAYFTQDEQQYLVQEFIDGQNLAQALAAEGTFKETQIRSLLSSLLPVLDFIHSHNIIHRDIKPENIIRRQDGKLVLVDFGAAKFATGTALARTGTVIGSAGYVPPEQAIGKAVFASDLYGLGITCIHLLTQAHPFDLFDIGENAWVWRQYLVNNPVSDELGHILDNLIENATNRRYQSVSEVLKDLNFHQKQQTAVSAVKPSVPAVTTFLPQPQIQNWRFVQTLCGHSKRVNTVVIDPFGQILASGGADEAIKLWDLSTGQLISTLTGHSGSIRAIAFSPDGKMIASCSNDRTVKIWDLTTDEELCTIRGHFSYVSSIAISPNKQTIASASEDGIIKLWHLHTGKEIRSIRNLFPYSIAISPDGKMLASSDSHSIRLWQLPTGQHLRTLGGFFCGHSSFVYSVVFSPDGQTLASSSGDKTIKLWNTHTGKVIRTLKTQADGLNSVEGHSAAVNSVVFSSDGQTLASGSVDKTIKLWQLDTGKVNRTLKGHSDVVTSVTFSPNGLTIVSGSWDRTIKIWRCD